MKNRKKLKFEVYARIVSIVSCFVDADTLEEALEVGRTLDVDEFITVQGDCQDHDHNVLVTGAQIESMHYNTDQRTQ